MHEDDKIEDILNKLKSIQERGYSKETLKELKDLMEKHGMPNLSDNIPNLSDGFDMSMEGASIAVLMFKWGIQNNGLEKTLEDIHSIIPDIDKVNYPAVNADIYDGYIDTMRRNMSTKLKKDK